jgi:hypothetical protein
VYSQNLLNTAYARTGLLDAWEGHFDSVGHAELHLSWRVRLTGFAQERPLEPRGQMGHSRNAR